MYVCWVRGRKLIGKLSTNHFSFNNLHTIIFLYNRTIMYVVLLQVLTTKQEMLLHAIQNRFQSYNGIAGSVSFQNNRPQVWLTLFLEPYSHSQPFSSCSSHMVETKNNICFLIKFVINLLQNCHVYNHLHYFAT